MRILHLIATLSAESGGPALACLAMADAVRARGHQVDIFTTDWQASADDSPLAGPSAQVHVFPATTPRQWKRSPELARALGRQIADYDLLHIHSLYLYHDWIGARLARAAGKPYIVRPHGLLDPYIWRRHRLRKFLVEQIFQNRALRQAAAIHYTSDDEMRISTPQAMGAQGVVVPLGVDLPPPVDFANRDRRRVLFLSRLHPKKGLDLLIPAFAQVQAQIPDASLVVAGPDDGGLQAARDLVARYGLQAAVSFPGMLRGKEKARAFATAGLFVLPSYSENFGIALAEAMAWGLPVVTTDQVNIHDAVRESGAGLVTSCQSSPLAAAMLEILGDADKAQTMGHNGRTLAATRYSWPAIGAQLEALYRDLIAKHGQQTPR